jgi:hypothetical protein
MISVVELVKKSDALTVFSFILAVVAVSGFYFGRLYQVLLADKMKDWIENFPMKKF